MFHRYVPHVWAWLHAQFHLPLLSNIWSKIKVMWKPVHIFNYQQRLTRPGPETQIVFKTKTHRQGRWRARLRAERPRAWGGDMTDHQYPTDSALESELFLHPLLDFLLWTGVFGPISGEQTSWEWESRGVLCHWLEVLGAISRNLGEFFPS